MGDFLDLDFPHCCRETCCCYTSACRLDIPPPSDKARRQTQDRVSVGDC